MKGNEKDCICPKLGGKHREYCDKYRLSEFMKKTASISHPTPPELGEGKCTAGCCIYDLAGNKVGMCGLGNCKHPHCRPTPQDTAQVIPQWRKEEPWISIEGVLMDCREFQLTIIESEEEIKKHVDTFLHSQLQMILERVRKLERDGIGNVSIGYNLAISEIEKLLLDAIGE